MKIKYKYGYFGIIVTILVVISALSITATKVFSKPSKKINLPFNKEIRRLIRPLKYSSLNRIMDPSTQLYLDFQNKSWSLLNIYQHDNDQNIVLNAGKEGLCEELTLYLYQKLLPIIGKEYRLDFAKVSEIKYFVNQSTEHYALMLSNKSSKVESSYIIDPSLNVYGRYEDLRDYYLYQLVNENRFKDFKRGYLTREVNECRPIILDKGLLLYFCVRDMDGRFDSDHFLFELVIKKKYNFSGETVYSYGRLKGNIVRSKDHKLFKKLLGKKKVEMLKKRIQDWEKENRVIDNKMKRVFFSNILKS